MNLIEEIELTAKEALSVLGPRERTALEHLARGHTRRATAKSMLVKRDTVKKYWQTAREKLREKLPAKLQLKFGALLKTNPQPRREIRVGSLSDVGV